MLSEKQEDFVLAPFRHTLDVAEGTPRSGKTTACVLRYFLFLNLSPDTNHLIVGATQTQAFRLAMDSDGNGLMHLWFDCDNQEDEKRIWYSIIQLLPSSYNQKRTIQLNYQVLWSMYKARKNHKLDEWKDFCKWIEELPYFKEIYINE